MCGWFYAIFQLSETDSSERVPTGLGLVKRQLLTQLLSILAEFCGQGFPTSQGFFQLPLPLIR